MRQVRKECLHGGRAESSQQDLAQVRTPFSTIFIVSLLLVFTLFNDLFTPHTITY